MTGVNPSSRNPSFFPLWTARAAGQRSSERLATGLRINRGSDDPAGLMASEALGARQAELSARMNALERESTFLNAREGALSAIGSLASDLNAITVRSAHAGATGPEELDALRGQVSHIVNAVDTAVAGSRFNGFSLLEGFDSATLGRTRIGTDAGGEAVYASARDLGRLMAENPGAAQAVARQAAEDVAVARGEAGVRQRAVESERRAAETEFVNTARARSGIRDTDYAREAAEAARAALLGEAALRAVLMGRRSAAKVLDLLA